MKTRTTRNEGFTLVEIMIVVALIGMLAAIAFPNYVRARSNAQVQACINNLRLIEGATQQWALETKQGANAPVSFTDIAPYLKNATICPAGGKTFADSYTLQGVTNVPLCQQVPLTHIFPPDTTN